MDSGKLSDILRRRKKQHIAWLNVSTAGHLLTTDEARELERLGYGELHGGANGIFWLHPVGESEQEQPAISLEPLVINIGEQQTMRGW